MFFVQHIKCNKQVESSFVFTFLRPEHLD